MAFHEYPYTDFHEMNLDWVIAKVKELTLAWAQTSSDWEELRTFVNDYFANLNVQEEINNKMDELVSDGTLSSLIAPYVASGLPAEVANQIAAVVADQIGAVVAAQLPAEVAEQIPAAAAREAANWLSEHVDPSTGYVVDDTLTIAGAAADAKATGNQITDLKSTLRITYINLFDKNAVLDDKYVDDNGNILDGEGLYYLTDFIPVSGSVRIKFDPITSPEVNTVIAKYNNNKVFEDRMIVSASSDFVVTYNGYIRINCLKSNINPDNLLITAGYGKHDYSNYYIANDIKARDDITSLRAYLTNVDDITFRIGNYSVVLGALPVYNSSVIERFCTDGYIFIREGEIISTKWSNVEFLPIFCDKNGIAIQADGIYTQSYMAMEDCYAYIVFKCDSISDYRIGNWLNAHSYYFHKYRATDSIWKGKTWYSFGTSMSDINIDGTTGNNNANGRWPLIVDELGGMTRTNMAIGGGGIVPSADHHGNVKDNIMQCPYDVDLVTFECGLNDWGSITLGNIGDKSDNTFIGNFTQCIEYLTYHTRAKIVFISMIPLTFTNYDTEERRDVFFKNSFGYTYRDYVNAMIQVCQYYGVEVIDAYANAISIGRLNKDTIKDTTHFNWLGGMIYGRYIWSNLKNILPLPKFPNNR